MKSELKSYKLRKLAEAYRNDHLKVKGEYQRGLRWTQPQNQALIDSLLRGYRIPLFYLHLEDALNTWSDRDETTASLVDGQQRLHAITALAKRLYSQGWTALLVT